ncbi:AMP-binding protein [Sphingomonas aliaeris]|uniref:AMP-binding protein n=1 Tax=Sphingomonas aliaeris TaxID=2759526 RepID=A0A974S4J9_9SPHN|nr:AMP-binding protein [Sphingomonas aliaeris]QQV77652.1 AMP-binding protein [Sphingomonas aliaeris]
MDALRSWAERQPNKLAAAMATSSEQLTYAELDQEADRVACMLQGLGIPEGGTIALLHENNLRTLSLWWGARRAGLYYVPLGTSLRPADLAFIVEDCAASAVFVTRGLEQQGVALAAELGNNQDTPIYCDGPSAVLKDFSILLEGSCVKPRPAALFGREMIYSSGTTGRPKGIRRDLSSVENAMVLPELERRMRQVYQIDERTIYLSLAPLYHATGRFLNRAIESGGSVVILPKFNPQDALATIERFAVSHTQWVPTMFSRLLALPEEIRSRYDLSSHKVALHAAAPCPIPVKRAMIEWWGLIVDEYYGGSENAGVTFISAREWLERPGSVGRSITGRIHILADDDTFSELPVGQTGLIYFEGGLNFQYTTGGDTPSVRGDLSTYGDLGHVDEDQYLFISDRRSDLIISGGVNIYPKEVELVIETYPSVREVAVIGVPDPEFGQQVKAVVCMANDIEDRPSLERALMQFCRENLSSIKCPKGIVFIDELPRNENGKLLKRTLRDRFSAP